MSDRASGTPSRPDLGLRYELLPLICDERRVAHLRIDGPSPSPAWWIRPLADQHPTETVLAAGVGLLGDWFDPAATIVHSTSWRHDVAHGLVVLSFVALLCPPASASGVPAGVLAEPLDLGEDGYAHTPAFDIRVRDVIAHGLRHFAMLRRTDPAVSATLSPSWHSLLSRFEPQPAGLVDHYATAGVPQTSTLPA